MKIDALLSRSCTLDTNTRCNLARRGVSLFQSTYQAAAEQTFSVVCNPLVSGQSLVAFAISQLVHGPAHGLAIPAQTVALAAFLSEAVAETVVDDPVPTDSAVAVAASAPTKSAASVFEVCLVDPSPAAAADVVVDAAAAAAEQSAAFYVEDALIDQAHACREAAAARTEKGQIAENPQNLSIDCSVPRRCVVCCVSARPRKDDLCE